MDCRAGIFTIVAKNYLPQARVLMRSVARQHPEWRRVVVLVDRIDGYFRPEDEDFEVILSSDLPIPMLRWFHFKYSILELSTGVKPYAFEYLFEKYNFDRLVYLDPDIKVFSPLVQVDKALDAANVVLTPHLTGALEGEKRPSEIDILRTGAYNLGFIAVRRTPTSALFLEWWQKRLYDHCVVDLPRGLFVDQKWVDLVPGLFEGVAILRDSGYNVAYWNLPHRPVLRTAQGFAVAGVLLAFFHFSGFDIDRPNQLSRHQNRLEMAELPAGTREILAGYRDDVLAAGYAECKSWPYAFDYFSNGTRIPDLGRPIHHESPEMFAAIDDPFSDAGFAAFVEVWNSPVIDDHAGRPGISRLAYRIYRTRTDVQSAMPDIFDGNYRRFLEWMLVSGPVEHGLGDAFLTTIRNAIETYNEHRGYPDGAKPVVAVGSGKLTRMAAAIYRSRPELQHYFPDPGGRDRLRFLVWLLTYGVAEHDLSEQHVEALQAQWREVVSSLPSVWLRLRYEVTRQAMQASVKARRAVKGLRALGNGARSRVKRPSVVRPQEAERPLEAGVNLVGYFYSDTGMGQAVRATQGALEAAAVPFNRRCVGDPEPTRQQVRTVGRMAREFPYATNVFHVNADESVSVKRHLGEAFYADRYNIGYWAWELEEFPEHLVRAYDVYQEIWTLSNFCCRALGRKAAIPVHCVPLVVAPAMGAGGLNRHDLGISSDKFVFLTAFDVLSVTERKNPVGVLRAFERAFGKASACELVIKVNHGEARPKVLEELRNAASGTGVKILDRTLSREEMYGLTRCADCVVSLHRSEGFGLIIAEAMYFGKPVIVTNYSGNTDFTRPDNALLVDYQMIPVGRNCEPYAASSMWADPDVEQAAAHMVRVSREPDLRMRLGQAGRELMRSEYSAEAVGRLMRERLDGRVAEAARTYRARVGAS